MPTFIRNMQSSLLLRRVGAILPGLLLAVLMAGVPLSLNAASITYSDANCASFQLNDNGGGSYTLVCVPTGGGGPNPPTNCTASVSPTSLPNTGGTVTLTKSCGNTDGTTFYKWTRNGAALPNNATSDVLPSNSLSTTVTYTYSMQACNGADCTAWIPANPGTVTVAASEGGGKDFCNQYPGAIRKDFAWNDQLSIGIGTNVLAVRITVPGNVATGYPYITVVEYLGSATIRNIAISKNACDFNDNSLIRPKFTSNYSEYFTTGNATGYPKLETGQTYYLNIRHQNANGGNTCTSGTCNMLIRFTAP
jgi:hypothetical protein